MCEPSRKVNRHQNCYPQHHTKAPIPDTESKFRRSYQSNRIRCLAESEEHHQPSNRCHYASALRLGGNSCLSGQCLAIRTTRERPRVNIGSDRRTAGNHPQVPCLGVPYYPLVTSNSEMRSPLGTIARTAFKSVHPTTTCTGPFTRSLVWLRQASRPRKGPVTLDVRARGTVLPAQPDVCRLRMLLMIYLNPATH